MTLYPKYQGVFDEFIYNTFHGLYWNIHLESTGLGAPKNLKFWPFKGQL